MGALDYNRLEPCICMAFASRRIIMQINMDIAEIKIKDKNYPPLLREIHEPPRKIFVRGKLPDFEKTFVAIVGTRKATEEGRALAKKTAKALAEKGMVIVSGLAMGVDAAAHEGALLGGGKTVAVLGNGIDMVYPAQNENLANKILKHGGAIISEYEPGTPAMPHQFLERNRIVAGLCQATIVIEAPAKSGAIVTARIAAEEGREVFVFPGPAGHPQHAGSHALIRDGARLVNSVEDILEDLSSFSAHLRPTLFDFENTLIHTNLEKHETTRINAEDDSPVCRTECLGGMPSSVSEGVGTPRAEAVPSRRSNETAGSGRQIGESARRQFAAGGEIISAEAQCILDLVSKSKTPLQVDKIIELTNLEPQAVNRELALLIISGLVEEDGSGYTIKIHD